MVTIMRTAGCYAVPKLGHSYNSTRQDGPLSQAFVRGSAHLNDLPSNFWGVSVKICEIQKDGFQLIFRSRDVGRACQKMFVPGFGEGSPEAKAADVLHNYFTYVAVKIVLSQLEDYNKEAYADLMEFVDRVPLKDGDKFCAALMRESFRHKDLALRIMEVRSAYAKQDFEWDNLKYLSFKQVEEANTSLMRKFLIETSNME